MPETIRVEITNAYDGSTAYADIVRGGLDGDETQDCEGPCGSEWMTDYVVIYGKPEADLRTVVCTSCLWEGVAKIEVIHPDDRV